MQNRKHVQRTLRVAGILAGLWIVLVFLVIVPLLAYSCREMYPELAHLQWPGMAICWAVGLMCALGLWEFAQVCRRIAKDHSFCAENAASFRRIRTLAWAVVGLLVLGTAGLCGATHVHPSLFVLLLLAGLPAAVVAMLCGTLAVLVEGAAHLQEDSDLTI